MKVFSGVLYRYIKKTVVTAQMSSYWSDLKKRFFFSKNLSFLPYAFNFYNYICKKRK